MTVPDRSVRFELEVKRSRFIAEIVGVSDREAAEQQIRERRQHHPDAAHVVYAFSLGGEKERQFGMSDDGEPRGTAGRPVLEILRGSEVTDCLVTVARYFGGTKLGTGGLVHAYGDVVKGAFSILPVKQKETRNLWGFSLSYELYQPVRAILLGVDAEIVDESFLEAVRITALISDTSLSEVDRLTTDVSRGTVVRQESSR